METKFTKGEWEINPRASRNVRCNDISIANCSSGQSGDREEEEHANAKLIATAPELLSALSNLLDELEDQSISSSTNLYIENAKKVIKKATE